MSNIKRTNISFISPNKLRPGLFLSLWLLPWTFLKCNTYLTQEMVNLGLEEQYTNEV